MVSFRLFSETSPFNLKSCCFLFGQLLERKNWLSRVYSVSCYISDKKLIFDIMKRSSLLQNTTLITFLKWANHGIFIIYFRSFQTKIITIFATNMCGKNVHPVYGTGIQPTTFEHVSPPITTRPGLL